MKVYKKDLIMLCIVLVFVIFHIITVFHEQTYIETRAEQGNTRWKQVEERLLEMENRITELEELENGGNN